MMVVGERVIRKWLCLSTANLQAVTCRSPTRSRDSADKIYHDSQAWGGIRLLLILVFYPLASIRLHADSVRCHTGTGLIIQIS